MNCSSDVGGADVSVVCGADATADGSVVGSASYVDGVANVSVVSVTSVVCCVDVTSVSCSSDDDGADVSVVCGADAAADGTEIGPGSYVDGEANVPVVSETNVVCCVDVTSVNGFSDAGEADVSVVFGADATADGTEVGSTSFVDGEVNVSVVSDTNVVCCVADTSVTGSSDDDGADVWIVDGESNVSVVSDTNVVCCVVVTPATVSSDVDDADVSVVRGGVPTADGTDVGTVSSVAGDANVSVLSVANVVCCVDVTSVNSLSDVGEADVLVVCCAVETADGT